MKSTYRLYQETGDISCVSVILRDAFGKFYWWTHFLSFLWNTASWDRKSFAKGYLIVFCQWQLQTSKNTNMNKRFWYIFFSASPTTAFLFSLKRIESVNRTAFCSCHYKWKMWIIKEFTASGKTTSILHNLTLPNNLGEHVCPNKLLCFCTKARFQPSGCKP